MKKITLEQIKEQYHQNDICMWDLLASIPAEGLSIEDAFNLYIAASKWADKDRFFCHRGTDDIEELGENVYLKDL